jgi:hypothetical protein
MFAPIIYNADGKPPLLVCRQKFQPKKIGDFICKPVPFRPAGEGEMGLKKEACLGALPTNTGTHMRWNSSAGQQAPF